MSDAYLGEIRMFAGSYAPKGWALCNGAQLQVKFYEALHTLIGNTYGGDGRNTFNLPDYRGRAPIGQTLVSDYPVRLMGETMGTEQVTMTSQNTPPHIHGFQVTNLPATFNIPTQFATAANTHSFGDFTKVGSITGLYSTGANASNVVAMNPEFLSTALGPADKAVQPHSNMMGSLPINYIICLSGTYPMKP